MNGQLAEIDDLLRNPAAWVLAYLLAQLLALVAGLDDLLSLLGDAEGDGDAAVLQRSLHESGDALRNLAQHIGNLLIFHEHLDAALVGIRDGGLHDLHALCQRGLFLGHRVDEGLPLQ